MADLEVYGHNGCVYKVCLSYSAYGVNDDWLCESSGQETLFVYINFGWRDNQLLVMFCSVTYQGYMII